MIIYLYIQGENFVFCCTQLAKLCFYSFKQENEKKERRGLGFRNVMNKGKGRGKKKMM